MLRLLLILSASLLVLGSNEFGVKFLEDNAKKDGVISLPSGLQYKVLRTGDGDSHPTADSSCECHYEGRTAENYPSGEKFDSSYDRGSPTSFAPNQVIKGWTEAMQLMVEGDKCTSPPDPSARPPDPSARPQPDAPTPSTPARRWEMYIPSDLGYGDRGSPPKIGGGSVLVFTMEIIKINGNKVPARCHVAKVSATRLPRSCGAGATPGRGPQRAPSLVVAAMGAASCRCSGEPLRRQVARGLRREGDQVHRGQALARQGAAPRTEPPQPSTLTLSLSLNPQL